MKRFLVFICLLVLLLPGMPGNASGQIFKKLFQREKTRSDNKTETTTPAAKTPKESSASYPSSIKKERYRIDVLAPLYMDELVKGNTTTFRNKVPVKALAGISFYEGVKLAADTIDGSRYKIDVYVHDITGPHTSVTHLIRNKTLASSDLLIGVVTSSDVTALANFARKKQVNFISVLSPSDGGVSNNPYFTLLQPTLHTHCDKIRIAARKKFPRNRIFLYRRSTTEVDETAYRLITAHEEKRYEVISCDKLPPPARLRQLFDSTATNVIIMPVLDTDYAAALLFQLKEVFPEYRFEVFGMPTWNNRAFLKRTEEFINIAFSFTTPFYFDHTTASGFALSERYHKIYGGTPNEWVFRGYETFLWYAGLLGKFGTLFNTRMNDYNTAVYTKYDIRPARDEHNNLLYNENRHLYLYRYQAGSYVVEH